MKLRKNCLNLSSQNKASKIAYVVNKVNFEINIYSAYFHPVISTNNWHSIANEHKWEQLHGEQTILTIW